MAPLKLDKLPVIGYLLKWFKTDDPVIDNDLFRLHHQVQRVLFFIYLIPDSLYKKLICNITFSQLQFCCYL